MSNGIDIELVKQNYSRMGNEELVRIATMDAAGMTPEAQQVIKDELKKRNMDSGLVKGVEAQNQGISVVEFDDYYELIRDLDCPGCGYSGHKLNATLTSRVMSFVIITHREKKLVIGCPDCLDKANNNALALTLILGWWGFPWGIIRTPMAVYDNIKSKKTNRIDQPNEYLKAFTESNIGLVVANKNNKQNLQQIIGRV